MKALLAGVLLVVSFTASGRSTMPPPDPDSYYVVPLVELIADPERWVGYKIYVTGYLAEHGNLFLYVSSESAKVGATGFGVMVANEFKVEPPLKLVEECESTVAAVCGNSFVAVSGEWIRYRNEMYLGRLKSIFKLGGVGGYCFGRYEN